MGEAGGVDEPLTEVLPGHQLPTWLVAGWIMGEEAWPTYDQEKRRYVTAAEDFKSWQDSPVVLFREHTQLVKAWGEAVGELNKAGRELDALGDSVSDPAREQWQRLHRGQQANVQHIEQMLQRHWQLMRRAGLVPPELDSKLAHLDSDDTAAQP